MRFADLPFAVFICVCFFGRCAGALFASGLETAQEAQQATEKQMREDRPCRRISATTAWSYSVQIHI